MDGNNIAGMNIVKLCASASSIADDCLRLPHFIVSTNIRIFFLEIVEISLFHASNRNIWSFLSSNTLQQDRKYIYNMINFPWQLCLVEVFVAVFGASFYSLFPEENPLEQLSEKRKKMAGDEPSNWSHSRSGGDVTRWGGHLWGGSHHRESDRSRDGAPHWAGGKKPHRIFWKPSKWLTHDIYIYI